MSFFDPSQTPIPPAVPLPAHCYPTEDHKTIDSTKKDENQRSPSYRTFSSYTALAASTSKPLSPVVSFVPFSNGGHRTGVGKQHHSLNSDIRNSAPTQNTAITSAPIGDRTAESTSAQGASVPATSASTPAQTPRKFTRHPYKPRPLAECLPLGVTYPLRPSASSKVNVRKRRTPILTRAVSEPKGDADIGRDQVVDAEIVHEQQEDAPIVSAVEVDLQTNPSKVPESAMMIDRPPRRVNKKPRRQRLALSCEFCRRRKIRCDRNENCNQCRHRKIACIWADVSECNVPRRDSPPLVKDRFNLNPRVTSVEGRVSPAIQPGSTAGSFASLSDLSDMDDSASEVASALTRNSWHRSASKGPIPFVPNRDELHHEASRSRMSVEIDEMQSSAKPRSEVYIQRNVGTLWKQRQGKEIMPGQEELADGRASVEHKAQQFGKVRIKRAVSEPLCDRSASFESVE